jgi:hypothetical protein
METHEIVLVDKTWPGEAKAFAGALESASGELEKTVRAPCVKCGEECGHDAAFHKRWGAGICRKCYRAYFCALLRRAFVRARYHKNRTSGKTAVFFEERMRQSQTALDAAAKCFHRDYAVNWKAHLREIFPCCERFLLESALGGAVEVRELTREGKEKGWL